MLWSRLLYFIHYSYSPFPTSSTPSCFHLQALVPTLTPTIRQCHDTALTKLQGYLAYIFYRLPQSTTNPNFHFWRHLPDLPTFHLLRHNHLVLPQSIRNRIVWLLTPCLFSSCASYSVSKFVHCMYNIRTKIRT